MFNKKLCGEIKATSDNNGNARVIMNGTLAVKVGLLSAIIKSFIDNDTPMEIIMKSLEFAVKESDDINIEIINMNKKHKKSKKEQAFEDLLDALKDALE